MPRYTSEQILILRFAEVVAHSDHIGDVGDGLDALAEELEIDLTPFEDEQGQYDSSKLEAALNPPEPKTFEDYLLTVLEPRAIAYLTMPMWRQFVERWEWPGDIDAFLKSWEDKGYLEKKWENLDAEEDPIVEEDFPDASPFWSGTQKLKLKLNE